MLTCESITDEPDIEAEILKEYSYFAGQGDQAEEMIMRVGDQKYRRQKQYNTRDWYRGESPKSEDKHISEELEKLLEVIYQNLKQNESN